MKHKNKPNARNMLSEKIAEALTVKPRADIEDDQVFGTKPKTVSRADFASSDSEDETLISDFRKRNVNLLSDLNKKYEGKVVSSKEFDSSDDDDEVMSGDDDTTHTTSHSDESHSDDDHNGDDDSVSDEEGSEDGEGCDISQMDEPVKESFEHIKKQNIPEEVKKGNSVRNQLLLWEGLLEMRIHLQRCLNTANRMPLTDTYNELRKNNEFLEESNITKGHVGNLLDKLLQVQNILLSNHPETKSMVKPKKYKDTQEKSKAESDEEIPSDTDNEEIPSDTDDERNQSETLNQATDNKPKTKSRKRNLDDYEKELQQTHKAFKAFRDSTIQKWNEKTRLATAVNVKNTQTNTILQQISYILADRHKLVRRTQLKRTEYDIIGHKVQNKDSINDVENPENPGSTKDRKDNDEYITEIFDDSDFYHQLLRELIECKSADISDPVQLSRQWIALQQMRCKMKRKVDTKATKGRRIKYVVHNKLVNFMAPEKNVSWTDDSKNELYNSLFGKMFEHSNAGFKKLVLAPDSNEN